MADAGIPTEFDVSGRGIEFAPAKLPLGEVLKSIQRLARGDVLHIGNAMEVVRVGDKNVLVDHAIVGRELPEKGKLIPPGTTGQDAFRSQKDESHYSHFMIDAPPDGPTDNSSSVGRIGRALAPHIDAMLISHLDADHIDFELTRTILEHNPKAEVYGPLGWKKYILRLHDREGTPSSGKPVLPDKLVERIHSFIPRRPDMNKPEPGAKSLIPTEIKLGNSVTITSLDVPHMGAPQFVEMTQGFLLESDAERVLVISDAAMSPELIAQVTKLHAEKALTHILISGATYNPETMYGILPPKAANWGREKFEEGLAHSAFLPVVVEALTNGEVPIDIVHHGFYYRSSADRKFLNFRLPAQKAGTETPERWFGRVHQKIEELMQSNKNEIDDLNRLSLALKHNLPKFLKDARVRLRFANNLVAWIKKEKVPQEVIDHLGMPQPGEIIKRKNSLESPLSTRKVLVGQFPRS